MGKHSSTQATLPPDVAGKRVHDLLLKDLNSAAYSMGIQIDPAKAEEILSNLYDPKVFTQDVDYASQDAIRNQVQNKILPTLYTYKSDPSSFGRSGGDPGQLEQAGNAVKSVLGRDATPEEAQYFAKELAQGKTAYELQQELQSLPEYQRTQAAKDRESLSNELLNQQQLAFQKATPEIISSFMRAGRLNSSGLTSALAQAQKELEAQRQGSLGQVGYQDLSSIRNNAYNAFQNYNAPFRQAFNPATISQNQFNLGQGTQDRYNQMYNYNVQKNDYNNYLENSQKNNGIAGAIQGGLAGFMATGSPYGALAGAGAGYFGTKK